MEPIRLILFLALVPALPVAAQECLPLGSELVTVTGTVARGPEGRSGQEKTYILLLDKPLCVAQYRKVREMQLLILSEHINKTVPQLLRHKLLVRGKLREAPSSRYNTPVVIEVEAVVKAS